MNTKDLNIGDTIRITKDGHTSTMTIWRKDAPGTAGTKYSDGHHIAAWISPGGYAINFDNSHIYSGRITVELINKAA